MARKPAGGSCSHLSAPLLEFRGPSCLLMDEKGYDPHPHVSLLTLSRDTGKSLALGLGLSCPSCFVLTWLALQSLPLRAVVFPWAAGWSGRLPGPAPGADTRQVASRASSQWRDSGLRT